MRFAGYNLRRRLADWLCPEQVLIREREIARTIALQRETTTLLHTLWGKAHDAESYVKAEWRRFHVLIDDATECRIRIARAGHVEHLPLIPSAPPY